MLRATDEQLGRLGGPDYSHVVPALLLSALLTNQCSAADVSTAQQVAKLIFNLIREAQGQRDRWCEQGVTGSLSLGSVRLGIVKNLFRSALKLGVIPDAHEVLPHVFAYAVDSQRLPALRVLAIAILCRHGAKTPAGLVAYAGEVMDVISAGGTELGFLLGDGCFANIDITLVGQKLPRIIDQLPSDLLIHHLKRVSLIKPEYLVPCVSRLVDDLLESSQRAELLSVLTALAVRHPGAVAPLLDKVRAACLVNRLYTPYVKLLCSCASHSKRTLHFSIRELIALLRSTEKLSESDLAALVGGLNVLKDGCPCSDIFQAETLTLLERAARHNWEAYINLRRWNRGDWARRGDLESFLRQGEQIRPRKCVPLMGRVLGGKRRSVAVEIAPKPLSVDTDMIQRLERRPPLKTPPSDAELLSAGKANHQRRPSLMVAVQVSLENLGKINEQRRNPLAPMTAEQRRPSFLDPIDYGKDSSAPTRGSFLTPLAPDPLAILAPIDYTAQPSHVHR